MISYLQIDKLTKSFGDLVLFEDITFGVAQGQKIGLIAKNGTGKTTLLNIIGGFPERPAGRVFGAITFLSGRTDRATGLLPLEERDCPVDR